MLFVFRPEHMLGLATGTLKHVISSTGVPLSMVRDAATGQIVGHAVGVVGEPFLAVPQMILGGAQMFQTHRGFQKTYGILNEGFQQNNQRFNFIQAGLQALQNNINGGFQQTYQRLDLVQSGLQSLQSSVGVLQATTAIIGVGTVAGIALSAVNLHQTLKLKEDVKQMRLEVKDGFIDMKKALKDQGAEIIQRLDEVAHDIKFEMHRKKLVEAYGLFAQGMKRFREAVRLQDLNLRNSEINGARDMFFQALAIYDNPHLLEETCSAGQLRRQECVWAIEQAITTSFQVQGAHDMVSHRLSHLQDKVRQDSLSVIDLCKSEEELDFLFPELTRIHNQDLPLLEAWQNHASWIQTLSLKERQLLVSSDMPITESSDDNQTPAVAAEPEEQLLYENLKPKSHYLSLRDQLKFMVKPDLRREHESYVSQQAAASGLKALAPSNWQAIPDLTVANLYWYFKGKQQALA